MAEAGVWIKVAVFGCREGNSKNLKGHERKRKYD